MDAAAFVSRMFSTMRTSCGTRCIFADIHGLKLLNYRRLYGELVMIPPAELEAH